MFKEIAPYLIIFALLAVNCGLGYLLFRLATMVAVLRAAPDAAAAKVLLKAAGAPAERPAAKKPSLRETAPHDLDDEAVANLRSRQERHG